MEKTFMPAIATEDELKALQLKGLQWTVTHAYNGSEVYRQRFRDAGISPEDVKSLEDLKKLPFTTNKDLQHGYPFPLVCVPMDDVVRIHASSGTTGKRKVLCYTKKDIEVWTHFFARCYELAGLTKKDRIQVSSGYGIWTAGVSFQAAAEALGAMAIPIGPGNIDMQIQFMEDFQTTVMTCTASMALLLAEEVNRRGLKDKLNLKKIIFGSERASDAMRSRIQELLGVEDVFDISGMTELYGPGAGLDCPHHTGIHYWADIYILEILDPITLEPVADGETGEMAVTTLKKEAVPLIRYRTRDLTRFIPGTCPCGSIFPRHDRFLGRSDDMIVFRGVNTYPGQIDHVLSSFSDATLACGHVGCEYRIILDRKDDGREYMLLKVERGIDGSSGKDAELEKKIAAKIKKDILVSVDVEIVDHGTLPRTAVGKLKRIEDNRYR
ncbi:MAG: phenylacetate--CoA ligase [Pseudomonadota bacterium]